MIIRRRLFSESGELYSDFISESDYLEEQREYALNPALAAKRLAQVKSPSTEYLGALRKAKRTGTAIPSPSRPSSAMMAELEKASVARKEFMSRKPQMATFNKPILPSKPLPKPQRWGGESLTTPRPTRW